jgi:hypothetical protein
LLIGPELSIADWLQAPINRDRPSPEGFALDARIERIS